MKRIQTHTALLVFVLGALLGTHVAAATPQELLNNYSAQAHSTADANKGRIFFTTVHAKDWSCSSCHTAQPAEPGKHVVTDKRIGPLAPGANAQRFTDAAKTEKWFKRNCNDVVGRECTAAEKADVIAWLLSVKLP